MERGVQSSAFLYFDEGCQGDHMRIGLAKNYIRSNALRLLGATCVVVALPLWMNKTDASIDPNPMPHISALEIRTVEFPVPSALQVNVDFGAKYSPSGT